MTEFYHVLHCKPQKDWHAVNNARGCGWQAMLLWFREPPKDLVRDRNRLRPTEARVRNLMPGYVFVTGGTDYYRLTNKFYINRILSDANHVPIKIPKDHPHMAALLARADAKGFVEDAVAPLFEYGEGDLIEIFDGPFHGMETRVNVMGKKLVEVELGRFGTVKIPHSQIRKSREISSQTSNR